MTESLYSLIIKCQHHDEHAILDFLSKFESLLKKYSSKLFYEDAYYDLQLALLEILASIPIGGFSEYHEDEPRIISYLCKAVYTRYIKLSIQNQQLDKVYLSDDQELLDFLCGSYCEDLDITIAVRNSLECLSPIQRKVIQGCYVLGYNDAEIGRQIGISRQAVGKTKRRAIEILRRHFEK